MMKEYRNNFVNASGEGAMASHFLIWWNELNNEIGLCQTEEAVIERMLNVSRELGFSQCAMGYARRAPFSKRNLCLCTIHPESWAIHYERHKYIDFNPNARPFSPDNAPLVWGSEPQTNVVRSIARPVSALAFGIAQPCWDTKGTFGVCSLTRNDPRITEPELYSLKPYLAAFAQITISSLVRLSEDKSLLQPKETLTNREIEILLWTADGKSAKSIARGLRISEDTVNFHLKNCMRKFNCSSKTRAACHAIALGLL
jgi:DNA-binding CsgD family transcriptional regulator